MSTFDFGDFYDFSEAGTAYAGPEWNELVGLNKAKKKFENILKSMSHLDIFQKTRLPFRASALLQGPPGTGKTTLTLAFGKKEKLPVVILLSTKIIRARLGESGENLSKAFQFIKTLAVEKSKPIILFIDEFDSFARERDDPTEIGEIKRLVNTLLTELDALILQQKNIFVIASTNHAKNLDSAAFRRFTNIIDFSIPSKDLRHRIWDEYLRRIKVVIPKASWDLDLLVDKTDGYTAADIERVVLSAVMQYISQDLEEITTSVLVDQLDYVTATMHHIEQQQSKEDLEPDDVDLRIFKGIFSHTKDKDSSEETL